MDKARTFSNIDENINYMSGGDLFLRLLVCLCSDVEDDESEKRKVNGQSD